jgi:hypothetical protein
MKARTTRGFFNTHQRCSNKKNREGEEFRVSNAQKIRKSEKKGEKREENSKKERMQKSKADEFF